jgi:hypothetical protein
MASRTASQHNKTAGCNYSATSQTNRRIKPNLDGSAVSIRFQNEIKKRMVLAPGIEPGSAA